MFHLKRKWVGQNELTKHPRKHTLTPTQINKTHTHTRAQTLRHTHTKTHIHTHTHTNIQKHKYTQTQTQAHTYTHAYPPTHTHMHIFHLFIWFMSPTNSDEHSSLLQYPINHCHKKVLLKGPWTPHTQFKIDYLDFVALISLKHN